MATKRPRIVGMHKLLHLKGNAEQTFLKVLRASKHPAEADVFAEDYGLSKDGLCYEIDGKAVRLEDVRLRPGHDSIQNEG